MSAARSQAVGAAVQAGTLTQEQADWLKTRGVDSGNAGARGNGRGALQQGGYAGMADRPYYPQTNP